MAGRRRPQVPSKKYGQDRRNGRGRLRWIFLASTVAALVAVSWWWWHSTGVPPTTPVAEVAIPPLPATVVIAPSSPEISLPPLPLLPPGPSDASVRPINGVPTNRTAVVIQVTTNIVRTSPPLTPGVELPVVPVPTPRDTTRGTQRPTNWLLAQIALAAYGISPGPIDGVGGAQSITALRTFQTSIGLEATGRLDVNTLNALSFSGPALSEFTISAADLTRLRPVPRTWIEKSEVPILDFENLPELVGEYAHCHPNLLRRLNPTVDWTRLRAGQKLTIPRAEFPPARRASLIRISLGGKWLRAFDDAGQLLAHFPCSIGARVEKRPVGALAVAVVVKNPNYTFDPATFPESAEAQSVGHKLLLPPGPNNPVGVAWIGLNRSGYGIHGTPTPELVGRTESHGCFRLANWNAEYLRQMCWTGLPVQVER